MQDCPILYDAMNQIRTYLHIVDPESFSYSKTEEEDFEIVLGHFRWHREAPHDLESPVILHKLKEEYDFELVDEQSSQETPSSHDEDYSEPIKYSWIIRVKDKLFNIPGIYDSQCGETINWEEAHEVIRDEKIKTFYQRKVE